MYIVTSKTTGANILRGDTVTNFRGEEATFLSVERGPDPESGRSAKVRVERTTVDTGTTYRMAYYAQVYNLEVVEA